MEENNEKKSPIERIPERKRHILTREDRSKGGTNSSEGKRERRKMKELINLAFSDIVKDENGEALNRKLMTAINLVKKASEGDLKAIELALKVNGEYENKVDISAGKSLLKISLGDDVLKVEDPKEDNDDEE